MKGSKLQKLKKGDQNAPTSQPNFKKKGEPEQPRLTEAEDAMEFSDEFEDEWEEEDVIDHEEDQLRESDSEEMEMDEESAQKQRDVIVPFLDSKKGLQEGEELELNNRAYKMFHRCESEWPCLSFDFIVDSPSFADLTPRNFKQPMKDFEYPIDLYAVGGSQSEKPQDNSLYLMRFFGLSITKYDDDEEADESFEEEDARLYVDKIPLRSGTNRIRTLMHTPVVALMNENAQLQVFDLRSSYSALRSRTLKDPSQTTTRAQPIKQFMLSQEGFGLEWSPLKVGRLACGTSDGHIHLFDPSDANFSDLVKNGQTIHRTKSSIEDLQFSPEQPDVLAACSADGYVRIFDLRTSFSAVSELVFKAHDVDVNVISWNKQSPQLLASGADDGSFKVWDLRFLGKSAISNIRWHSDPITAIEWQLHDEWTIAVASADNRLSVWDFSVEKDDEEVLSEELQHVPDQMLFLHQGQEDLKEFHWHPLYLNVLMSTASDGYNIMHPAIDEQLSSTESPNDLELIPDPIEE